MSSLFDGNEYATIFFKICPDLLNKTRFKKAPPMFKSKEKKRLEKKIDEFFRLTDPGNGFGGGDQEMKLLVAGALLANEKLKEMRVRYLEWANVILVFFNLVVFCIQVFVKKAS